MKSSLPSLRSSPLRCTSSRSPRPASKSRTATAVEVSPGQSQQQASSSRSPTPQLFRRTRARWPSYRRNNRSPKYAGASSTKRCSWDGERRPGWRAGRRTVTPRRFQTRSCLGRSWGATPDKTTGGCQRWRSDLRRCGWWRSGSCLHSEVDTGIVTQILNLNNGSE